MRWFIYELDRARPFINFRSLAEMLLNQIKTTFATDQAKYSQLADAVGNYESAGALREAFLAYRDAVQSEALSSIPAARDSLLKELDLAAGRKDLINTQSRDLAEVSGALDRLNTEAKNNADFIDPATSSALVQAIGDISKLASVPSNQRGDIAIDIQKSRIRLADLTAAIAASRAERKQSDELKLELVSKEATAKELVISGGRGELTSALGSGFTSSAATATKQLQILTSLGARDLWDRKADAKSLIQLIGNLAQQLEAAKTKYSEAVKTEELRASTAENARSLLTALSVPEIYNRLSAGRTKSACQATKKCGRTIGDCGGPSDGKTWLGYETNRSSGRNRAGPASKRRYCDESRRFRRSGNH